MFVFTYLLLSWDGEELSVGKQQGKGTEVSPFLTQECSHAALLQHAQQCDPQWQKPQSWGIKMAPEAQGLVPMTWHQLPASAGPLSSFCSCSWGRAHCSSSG